jgi:hypothetical protein
MPLPQEFDQNEWFLIIALIISFTLILFLPRRFPLSITILIMLFSITVARLSDHLLAGPNIDLYNLMDTGKYDLFDLFLYFLYAPFGYLFVYLYEKLNIKGFWILLYIIICSIAGTMIEGLCVLFDVFNYKGWKLSYSFCFYLAVQALTLLFYHYIKRSHHLLSKK